MVMKDRTEDSMQLSKVLIIDDEVFFCRQLSDLLEERGFYVIATQSGLNIERLLAEEDVTAIICDIEMPDISGTEVLRQIKRLHPEIPVIMLSAHQRFSIARDVLREGAIDYLVKPLNEEDLFAALDRAIEIHRRHIAAKTAEQESRRRLSDIVLLKEIGETASAVENPQLLFDLILESITTSMQVGNASLMLREEDGYLRIRSERGLPPGISKRVRIAPGEGISGHVLDSGRPTLVDDINQDPRFGTSEFSKHYQTRSLLSVPLRVRDAVIGVLNVNNKSSGEKFSADDQNLLCTIAHQAALAIENFRLVSSLKVRTRELEEVNRDLHLLNQTRSNLICNLSHELNTPLTSVLGYVELILNFPDRFESGELLEHLNKVYRQGLRMERIVSSMLRFFSLDSEEESWDLKNFPLNVPLAVSLQKFRDVIQEKSLRIELDFPEDLPEIYGDQEKMGLLFDALFDNAIKFNRPEGKILLVASRFFDREHEYVRLKIYNDGMSISQDTGFDVFNQFTQLGNLNTNKPAGVGIGLAICKIIVEKMKGTIRLENSQDEGTTFSLLLPTSGTYGVTHAPGEYQ